MAKKNIAFLLTKVSKKGGISRVASIVTGHLQEFNVHVIGYQKKDEDGYDWHPNVHFHNLREDSPSMKKGLFKAAIDLNKILRKERIPVLVVCGNLVGPLGVFASLFTRVKLIFWSHSSFKGSTGTKKYRKIYEQFIALFSHTTISLTKTDADNYKKHTLAKRVGHIYNPIDSALLTLNHEYNPNEKKLISVGRLTYSKRFDMVITLASRILEKNPDWEWHIYGSGEEEHNLKEQIIQNNLEKKVILKGQSNSLYQLYNQYGIMVMTSEYEGFPMTLIEGMASELPLVSFDIDTGPNEIIEDGYNGFLIPKFDLDAMETKIQTLIQDPGLRTTMAKNHKSLLAQFQLDAIIPQWVKLLS